MSIKNNGSFVEDRSSPGNQSTQDAGGGDAPDRYAERLREEMQYAGLTTDAACRCGRMSLHRRRQRTRKGKLGVPILKIGGRARLAGIAKCGSINVCPSCRRDRFRKVRSQITQGVEYHVARGGIVRTVSLTLPHRLQERCAVVLRDCQNAATEMMGTTAWRDLSLGRNASRLGYCRVLEIVHGDAGWHPHYHLVLFLRALSTDEEELLRSKIVALWIEAVRTVTVGRRVAVARHQVWSADVPATYAAKGDVHRPSAVDGGKRSPFDLARLAVAGDAYASALVREYLIAIHRTQPISWDKPSLKRHKAEATRVKADASVAAASATMDATATDTTTSPTAVKRSSDAPDSASAAESPSETVAVLPDEVWGIVSRTRGACRALEDAATTDGFEGVVRCLTSILWRQTTHDKSDDVPDAFYVAVREEIQPFT